MLVLSHVFLAARNRGSTPFREQFNQTEDHFKTDELKVKTRKYYIRYSVLLNLSSSALNWSLVLLNCA